MKLRRPRWRYIMLVTLALGVIGLGGAFGTSLARWSDARQAVSQDSRGGAPGDRQTPWTGDTMATDRRPGNGPAVWSWGLLRAQTEAGWAPQTGPEQVAHPHGAVAIAAGSVSGLVLGQNGAVSTWWVDGAVPSTAFQLGTVALDDDVIAIAAGDHHNLALRADGTVWAWGANTQGQLGDGTQAGRSQPHPVLGLDAIIAVAAGGRHSLALRRDGAVLSWGERVFGALGETGSRPRLLPAVVPGLPAITAIAAGSRHSMALAADGTVWTWGLGSVGSPEGLQPVLDAGPQPVGGLDPVLAIAAGASHSLALTAAGASHSLALTAAGDLWAWGSNAAGQLGDGRLGGNRPRPAPVIGLPSILDLAAGDEHSLALDSTGRVWAWGQGRFGQLGAASAEPNPLPSLVPALVDVTGIAARGTHSIALQRAPTTQLPQFTFQTEPAANRTLNHAQGR